MRIGRELLAGPDIALVQGIDQGQNSLIIIGPPQEHPSAERGQTITFKMGIHLFRFAVGTPPAINQTRHFARSQQRAVGGAQQHGFFPLGRKDKQILVIAEQVASGRHVVANPERFSAAGIDRHEVAQPLEANRTVRYRSQKTRSVGNVTEPLLPSPGLVGHRPKHRVMVRRIDARTHQVMGP